MLDLGIHQGSGLGSFMPQTSLRIVAMASQDGAAGAHGLETLWQVCASLQRLGYPVIVLDGTATETDHSPGLIHLLQQTTRLDGARLNMEAMATSLAVLPAARGLERMLRNEPEEASPWDAVQNHLRAYGVLVVHAPPSVLGPLLEGTQTSPLVVLSPQTQEMLQSYRCIKELVLDTGLSCLLAAVVRGSQSSKSRQSRHALLTLQDCAARYLPGQVRTTMVDANDSLDFQRLALQLMENAGTIHGSVPEQMAPSLFSPLSAPFARSH